jgi:hypothetical protein
MAIPLGHFVVGFGFLLAACGAAIYAGIAETPSVIFGALHLCLAGWVGITIMGAMTQFIPVWSGVDLHSRQFAVWQLGLVTAGVPAIASGMARGRYDVLVVGGVAATLGFYVFVYNVGRTLAMARPFDVTEFHFAWTLAFVASTTAAGVTLGATYAGLISLPLTASNLRATHATLAVFGIVLTTVFGALYQLATMFTQTELRGIERHLRSVETYGYPFGVVCLAAGRLLDVVWVGRLGAVLVVIGVGSVGGILGRRVFESRVGLTPMLGRYGLVAIALSAWALFAAPTLLWRPTDPTTLFGPPGADRLLWFGVVALVVFGTLYHIVPFIVWVERYSDRLGYEPVPMVDDLYVPRLASLDLVALTSGIVLLIAAEWVVVPGVEAVGVGLVTVGVVLFVANMAVVFLRHGLSAPTIRLA